LTGLDSPQRPQRDLVNRILAYERITRHLNSQVGEQSGSVGDSRARICIESPRGGPPVEITRPA
jgi:hypothetical protein